MKIKLPTFLTGGYREVEIPKEVLNECRDAQAFYPLERFLEDETVFLLPLGEHFIDGGVVLSVKRVDGKTRVKFLFTEDSE